MFIVQQVIQFLKDAFDKAGIPVFVCPYAVIPIRTEEDALGGILQVVPKVVSRDQLGREGTKTIKQHFIKTFGAEHTHTFKHAQMNYIASVAGYAVVCYLLGIKVRESKA